MATLGWNSRVGPYPAVRPTHGDADGFSDSVRSRALSSTMPRDEEAFGTGWLGPQRSVSSERTAGYGGYDDYRGVSKSTSPRVVTQPLSSCLRRPSTPTTEHRRASHFTASSSVPRTPPSPGPRTPPSPGPRTSPPPQSWPSHATVSASLPAPRNHSPGQRVQRTDWKSQSSLLPPPATRPVSAVRSHTVALPAANIGPYASLETLKNVSRFDWRFKQKVHALSDQGYVGWRSVRADGNCFYRAVGYGLLEELDRSTGDLRFAWTTALLARLLGTHFHDPAEQRAHTNLTANVARVLAGPSARSRSPSPASTPPSAAGGDEHDNGKLYKLFCDPSSPDDMAFIRALRRITADYLWRNASDGKHNGGVSYDIACAAKGYLGVEDFCKQVVLPVGVDAEGIALEAAALALGIKLRIAVLDRSGVDVSYDDFGDTSSALLGGLRPPHVYIQMRIGHFDLLYQGRCLKFAALPCEDMKASRSTSPRRDTAAQAIVGGNEHQRALSDPPQQTRKKRPPTFGADDDAEWRLAPNPATPRVQQPKPTRGVPGSHATLLQAFQAATPRKSSLRWVQNDPTKPGVSRSTA